MELTLRQIINKVTKNHLENNEGLLLGQAISAVGWVNETVPNCKNIIELPMCDSAGVGITVGAAISGRRPILVIRYQDFITIGMSQIVNYAAKTKEFFNVGTPIFVRLIADENVGVGPVHSGKFHNLFLSFPGVKVCAPITPMEYQEIWNLFMKDDCPYIVSEHRASFNNTTEFKDSTIKNADITLYGISIARFNMYAAQKILAKEGILCNVTHIKWLKPLTDDSLKIMTKYGLIIDTGFKTCGASEHIAYRIMEKSGSKVFALGLEDVSIKCSLNEANQTPSVSEIVQKVKDIVK